MSRNRRALIAENRWLLGGGVTIEAALLYLVSRGDLAAQVPLFWGGIFAAFLGYLLAALPTLRRSAGSLHLILAFGLLFRLTMWWSPPTLSDDIYRYVWDGRVQQAGINPYRYAPAAPALVPLRDDLYTNINHKDIPTIYPPLAQLFFRLVGALGPGPGMMKLSLILVECGLVLLLVQLLGQRRQDPCRVLLYAWNPLPLVEIAGSGHIDVLGVCLLFLALYGLGASRPTLAVWALAGAFLSKLLPALALPVFWRHLAGATPPSLWARWLLPRGRGPLLWFPLVAGAGFLFFGDAGFQLVAGLQTYLLKWRFNDALFSLVYGVIKAPDQAWDQAALLQTKLICAGILLLALVWATSRYSADPYRALFVIIGTYLLVSPTLHPWYLLWILPFLPLFPQPAWVLLSGLIFLAYEVLIGYSKQGVWVEGEWVKWAQYGPFYALLTLSLIRDRGRAKRPAGEES